MNNRERGILIGLAVILAAGIAFIVYRSRDAGAPDSATAPGGWDTSRLPNMGQPLRHETTAGGVVIQIMTEGKGEPVASGQAMDITYEGYSPESGAMFQRGVKRGLVLEQGGVIPGWIEGLRGIRLREKRRLLIPSEMAYGDQRVGSIAPNSNLVFDVEWVHLEIKDVREGSGKKAKRGSRVLVHYKGTLESGTVFDSSYDRGEPLPATLKRGRGGVIDGWIRGVAGMRVGGIRNLWIPWYLAYGDRPKGKIPPYSNLQFVVELLDVE